MGKKEDYPERAMLKAVAEELIKEGVNVKVYEKYTGLNYYVLLDKGVLGHIWVGDHDKDYVIDFDKGQYYDSGYGHEQAYWYYEGERKLLFQTSLAKEFVGSIVEAREGKKREVDGDYGEFVKAQKVEDLEEDFWEYAEDYVSEEESKSLWENKTSKTN